MKNYLVLSVSPSWWFPAETGKKKFAVFFSVGWKALIKPYPAFIKILLPPFIIKINL